MSNYIKNAGAKYDTINAMKPDLSPAARTLFIAALMVLPLMLVILQRLDDIKEIRRRQKDGEKMLNFRGMFNANSHQTGPADTAACGRCGAQNPRGQAFCGACGNKLDPPEKEQACD